MTSAPQWTSPSYKTLTWASQFPGFDPPKPFCTAIWSLEALGIAVGKAFCPTAFLSKIACFPFYTYSIPSAIAP